MAGEKRSQDQDESLLKESFIIVDIEGTTTSINFVKEKLFPYVRENVKSYLNDKWEDEEFKRDLEKLKEQAKKDEEDKIEGLVPISGSTIDEEKESVLKNIIWQMDGDRKTGALKQLQGHIWREAYASGKIKGHVYKDVPECLKSWKNGGKKIYVYSSGSVEAQKLLFGNSEYGDLLEYFSGYFDTGIGMKQESTSYKNILKDIKAEGSDVIFLTDVVNEAKAAKEAGLSTMIMIREGNAPLTDEDKANFKTASSFLDLSFASAAKRQKLETSESTKKEDAKADPAVEKIEVTEDVEMTDVSDNKEVLDKVDSKNDEGKIEAGETKEVVKEDKEKLVESEKFDKDEAMETDGKAEPQVTTKKVDEKIVDGKVTSEESKEVVVSSKAETIKSDKEESGKLGNIEEGVKSDELSKPKEKEDGDKAEGESDEKKIAADDETDKSVIGESKKLELKDKNIEISEEKKIELPTTKSETESAADEAMEESSNPTTGGSKSSKAIENNATEKKTEDFTGESSVITKDKLEKMETDKKEEASNKPDVKGNCTKPEAAAATPKSDEVETKVVEITDSENKVSKQNDKSSKPDEAVKKSIEASTEETVKENGTSTNKSSSKENVEVKAKIEIGTDIVADNKEIETDPKKTDKKIDDVANIAADAKLESEAKSKEDKIKSNTDAGLELKEAKNDVETKDSDAVGKSGEDKKQFEKETVLSKTDISAESSKDDEQKQDKKVNGTTQNGAAESSSSSSPQTSSSSSNDNQKIHTNGVNEAACTSDAAAEGGDAKTNKEAISSPLKREAESSNDQSAESIKVKKVVDSTVAADGAGEPDVVPPAVVVAATS